MHRNRPAKPVQHCVHAVPQVDPQAEPEAQPLSQPLLHPPEVDLRTTVGTVSVIVFATFTVVVYGT